jgi:hypothetical protein
MGIHKTGHFLQSESSLMEKPAFEDFILSFLYAVPSEPNISHSEGGRACRKWSHSTYFYKCSLLRPMPKREQDKAQQILLR